MKTYVVATNVAYTVMVKARSKKDAVMLANVYHYKHEGTIRDDFVAYEINEWMEAGEVITLSGYEDEMESDIIEEV